MRDATPSRTSSRYANLAAISDGINLRTISGMAPRARLSIYKTCYGDGVTSACFISDSVAAIDQGVADGVDVINYSIGGARTSNIDPIDIAFLFAADAGVFVAASAGNSGPAASTRRGRAIVARASDCRCELTADYQSTTDPSSGSKRGR